VKLASLIAKRPTLVIFGFSGAELTKVLCSPRCHVRKKLKLDATEGLSYCFAITALNLHLCLAENPSSRTTKGDIEEHDGIGILCGIRASTSTIHFRSRSSRM
jgi:hypothetical protein